MKRLIFLCLACFLCYCAKAQTLTIVNHTCDNITLQVYANSGGLGCAVQWYTSNIGVASGTTSPTYTTSTLPWAGSKPTGTVDYAQINLAGTGACPATTVGDGSCMSKSASYTTCHCSGSYTAVYSVDPSGNVTLTIS